MQKPQEQMTPVRRRQFKGVVVSTAEQKTARVRVATVKMHPKYHKQYTVHKTYAIHDEMNQVGVGDVVRFEECRPYSSSKRWRLLSVLVRQTDDQAIIA